MYIFFDSEHSRAFEAPLAERRRKSRGNRTLRGKKFTHFTKIATGTYFFPTKAAPGCAYLATPPAPPAKHPAERHGHRLAFGARLRRARDCVPRPSRRGARRVCDRTRGPGVAAGDCRSDAVCRPIGACRGG